MTLDPLVTEIARLHRGRGIRRADLGDALGPSLRAALGIVEAEPGQPAVQEHLRVAAVALPKDLRLVFEHALGVSSTQVLLGDRIDEAATLLHVAPRTVRRRLGQANQLVARELRHPSGRPGDPAVRHLTHQVSTDLRRPVVRLTSAKKVVRRRPGDIVLEERFGVPGRVADDGPPSLQVGGGASLLDIEPVSATVWRSLIRLHSGEVGSSVTYSLTVELPDITGLSPFTVVVPMQPLDHCEVTVHFGGVHPVSNLQEARGVLPVTLYERLSQRTGTVPVPVPPSVKMTVDRPQLGHAYGFVWSWQHEGVAARPASHDTS